MNRRLSIFIIILAVLVSLQLHAKMNAKLRAKRQKYINQAQKLTERFNRLGEVFVQGLKKEVEDIIDKNRWKALGLKERKIYLFISFKKLESTRDVTLDSILTYDEKALKYLKTVVYNMLANAIKSAINHDRKLKNYIVTLSPDPQTLKAAIAETGDPMYNQSKKLEFSNMDSMNANYHFFFEAFKKTNKIALNGGADIIEMNHEIATTYNYEVSAKELFDKYYTEPLPVNKIKAQNVELNSLDVSILCKRKGERDSFQVSPNHVFYSGDRIWFDIILPELGGYLLVYAQDSHGKVFNLFPGTEKAAMAGKYKIPFHLKNYSTEVLKVVMEQSQGLPKNKVRIGGYTLDEKAGNENIFFYYSHQRNKDIEKYLEEYAVDVGKDIKFKGFDTTVEKYTQGDVDASIKRPILHYRKTMLIKHE